MTLSKMTKICDSCGEEIKDSGRHSLKSDEVIEVNHREATPVGPIPETESYVFCSVKCLVEWTEEYLESN